MKQVDLAGRGHWNELYHQEQLVRPGWTPGDYDSLVLEHALISEIRRVKPKSVLEIGCGNSVWLPYLAKTEGVAVSGIDYSGEGCQRARQRLSAEGVSGSVFCEDIFAADPAAVGRYDLVYSLGVLEHYTALDPFLTCVLRFVNEGGLLFTEVPNLMSIHGLMSWVWQPRLLARHRVVTRRELVSAYARAGLTDIRGEFLGEFSLNIIAWELSPRWPRLAPVVVPCVRRLGARVDAWLRRRGQGSRGHAALAPFIYAVGQKPRGDLLP